jgi:alpha-beta hydrolase superfamily lysophospholipase
MAFSAMSTSASPDSDRADLDKKLRTAPLSPAEALYFDSNGHGLFGWLHRPAAGTIAPFGLVICKPFGYEAICSHRSLRAFAEEAAKCGVPVLLFDYLGTGDSADIDPLANQLDVWSHDVVAAVNELLRRTGVARVCLLGLRLGASLAMMAASECITVDSLILIAPVISGRRYLRELRMTRLAASLRADPTEPANESPSNIEAASDSSFDASGFTLSAATMAAIAKVDLNAPRIPTVAEILIIDGDTFPGTPGWTDALRGLGISANHLILPGLIQMIMTGPEFASIPNAMLAAVSGWLAERLSKSAPPCDNVTRLRSDSVPGNATAVLTLSGDGVTITERPIFFDSEGLLFGIVTEPQQGEQRRRAAILLNSGADQHIGPNRMHVSLARRWAGRGIVVLRIDLSGLGDSNTRPGQTDDDVFPITALEDIRSAISYIHSRYAARDITLAGLCSGAYHALRAAAAGAPVVRILMVNPLNYFWKQGTSLRALQLAEVVRNPGVYRKQIFSNSAWRRVFTGRVNVWRIPMIYTRRLRLSVESKVRDLARRLHIRLAHDLGSDLVEIVARGIRVAFVFSPGEPGIDLLKIEGGSSVGQLGEHCRVYITDGGDHIFSQRAPRAAMEKILGDELFARTAWVVRGRAELKEIR